MQASHVAPMLLASTNARALSQAHFPVAARLLMNRLVTTTDDNEEKNAHQQFNCGTTARFHKGSLAYADTRFQSIV